MMNGTQIVLAGVMVMAIIAVAVVGIYYLQNKQLPGVTTTATTTISNVKTIDVSITEYKFIPNNITVTHGTSIQLKVINNGLLSHNLFISGLNVGTQTLTANQIGYINITNITKGSYQGQSTVDGDAALGLKINLTVT